MRSRSARQLGLGIGLIAAGGGRLLDRLPERLQDLAAEAMIAIGTAVLVTIVYPDLRTWVAQAWQQTTTVISAAAGLVLLAGWMLYMRLRGRERQARAALVVAVVLMLIAGAMPRNPAASS